MPGGYIWLTDALNGGLLRLDITNSQWNFYPLPVGSAPVQVALDANGNAWYTDNGLTELGMINPNLNQLTRYDLPAGTNPQMIAASGGKARYTDQSPASIGMLDPSQNPATPVSVTTTPTGVTPSCKNLPGTSSATATSTPGTPSWTSHSYTTSYESNGWAIYSLPSGAQPFGIVITDLGYVVDSLRSVLIRFSTDPTPVSLANFKATSQPKGIQLTWQTGQEIDLVGFNLFRADAADGTPGADQSKPDPCHQPWSAPG